MTPPSTGKIVPVIQPLATRSRGNGTLACLRTSAKAAGPRIPFGPSVGHEPNAEDHPNRYANPSKRSVTIRNSSNELGIGEDHAARSTLITQVSRSLVLINALGTTGILIPKALNAARMRAA